MPSWEICEIEEVSIKLGNLFVKGSSKYTANLYTPDGLKVIYESPEFDPKIYQVPSESLKKFVATLANEGWEPIPIRKDSTLSGLSYLLWLFKRLKPDS